MKKLYIISTAAMITAIGTGAQTADNLTVIKGSKVVGIHNAGDLSRLNILDSNTVQGTTEHGTEIFSHRINEIDEISFVDVPAIDSNIFVESTTFNGWKELTISLSNGQELQVSGVSDIDAAFQRHLFDTVDGRLKFKGPDGEYTMYYKPGQEAFWLENRDKKLADGVIYLFGSGFGHAGINGVSAGAWTWATPQDIQMANKVADGVYEANIYLGDGFAVKFFHQVGWGGEYGSTDYIPYPASDIEMGWAGNDNSGHFSGDFVPGDDFVPGIYTIRIDTGRKFCTLLKEGETAHGSFI